MSDKMLEHMSERMPDRMSESMPDRLPDRMSDRMPEYICQHICQIDFQKIWLINCQNIKDLCPNIGLDMSRWGSHEVKYFFRLWFT